MRISGITIPDNKNLSVALTAVYGVGRKTAEKILQDMKLPLTTKATDISENQEIKIREAIEAMNIEGDLRREISNNIKRLKDIDSYRGSRHARRLPANGQRTKTNARTRKGVKRTMGTGRRKVDKK